MAKQANNQTPEDNQTPEPNALEQAEYELSTLQAERANIPAALNQAVEDGDTREIICLRQRSAELKDLIPTQTLRVYQLQVEAYQKRSTDAEAEAVELAYYAEAAAERARAANKEANRIMGELSNLQSMARQCRQDASQIAGQRSQLLRQMQGQEVDRALRMPLQNPMFG